MEEAAAFVLPCTLGYDGEREKSDLSWVNVIGASLYTPSTSVSSFT